MNQDRAIARAERPHLRLVTPSLEQAAGQAKEGVTILELASVAATDKHVLQRQVITQMLESMDPGDWVEFRHDIVGESGRPRKYRLAVVTKATGRSAQICAAAVQIATPLQGWAAVSSTGAPQADCELPLRGSFAPAAAQVFTEAMLDATPLLLPVPCSLPDWRLTEALSGVITVPDRLQLRMQLHPYRLDEAACASVWRALQHLRANACRVFHPGVRPGPYNASEALRNDLIALLQAWLAQPVGYTFALRIAASEELDPMTLAHLARDVFGGAPFEVADDLGVGYGGWSFHRALRFEQGLPALLPHEQLAVSLGVPRHYAAPQVRPASEGCLIGHVADKQGDVAVGLPESIRSRHVAIIGSTGAGKSSLMLNMIDHDLHDPARPGVVLIDPHGDLYQAVLPRIPSERRGDVVLVDVTDPDYSACINPLAAGRDSALRRSYVIQQTLELIDLLFETDQSRGPALTHHLWALMDMAAGYPGRAGTFLDVLRALREPDFIEWLLVKLGATHPESVAHWMNFQRTTGEQGFANWVPYLSARISPFTGSPVMKRLLCQPEPTLNFESIFRDRKIVLFNFSKSVLHDTEARVASSVALMQLFSAAMSRASMPPSERFPVHLYADEFQSIATASTARMLAEARKLNLCLTVAFQNIGQLKTRFAGELASTLLANTATRLLFRLNPGDAALLDDYYKPALSMADMTTMADFHAACVMPGQSGRGAVVLRCRQPAPAPLSPEQLTWPPAVRGLPVSAANQTLLKLYEIPLSSLQGSW